jgi:uncharacterized protein (DUF486 family)
MLYEGVSNPEQWILLTVFFAIFAFCGFIKKPNLNLRPGNFIIPGILLLIVNCLLLIVANKIGYDSYNLAHLLSLKQIPIESSFIVLGYCLIIRGIAIYLRYLFTPSLIKSRRTVL